MTEPNWYAMQDLPRGRVHVRLRWGGYRVEAVGDIDAKGRRHFHEIRDGRHLVPLRAAPTGWQPLDVRRWIWPNGVEPFPLVVKVEPQIGMIGGLAFAAVAAAEDAESEREAPRAQAASQWWRDVQRVEYESMGHVSREHGEARIMRALILERSIRMDVATRYRTNAAVLADLKRTLADVLAEAPAADWVPRLEPMPEDWRDFDIVMGWLVEVLPSRAEMFVMRARMLSPPATWIQIGDEIGRDARGAKRRYERAIEDLIAAANRRPRRARARLAELQERNREAKR